MLGFSESGKFNVNPTHCSILMSSGYVYPYSAHGIIKYVCACAYISAWASVLLVQNDRQCESLEKRNSNSAVPLFVFTKAEQQFS